MSNRLNQQREEALQPERMDYATHKLRELGIEYMADDTTVCFKWKGSQVKLFPYSGWHSGKTIVDGRGIDNLLKQLK